MPYILNKTARKKSKFYTNIMDADEQEQLRVAQKELKRMQISGSNTDGTFPIRDENGVLLSFQSPFDETKSVDEPYQYVRLQLNQKSGNTDRVLKFFGSELDFTDIYPKEVEEEDVDIDALREEFESGIERNNELNTELANAIDELNKKIAEINKQPEPAPTPKPEKKDLKSRVKKVANKIKKKLKKWFSDERLKRDIVPLGIENGYNTYGFRYLWGTQRYKGVMAQEVIKTKPQAVDKLFGFYRVDYDEIGVEFIKC